MVTRETVARLIDTGEMVTVRWPESGDLRVSLQRHMIDDAMVLWPTLEPSDRNRRMGSVRKAIKRTTKKIKQGRATGKDSDDLAADVALFVGHELVYADGERWLVKGPTSADILHQ